VARLIRVLDEAPELGDGLDGLELDAARRVAVGVAQRVDRGMWRPDFGEALAGIVHEGVLLRTCAFGAASTATLAGPGDLLLEPVATGEWRALQPVTILWLGASFERASQRWPVLTRGLLRLAQEGNERAMALQAIAQLQRVDDRIIALLWQLAERWGRMTRDGVVLDLRLQHRVLGDLVGARRPSVTTALGLLSAEGRVVRRTGGGWLLRGEQPAPLPLAAGAEDAVET
jgi:CRP-like cAMP-binding protein